VDMRQELIAAKILVKASKYLNEDEAIEGLKSAFRQHFPSDDYVNWNKEIPATFAQNIIDNVSRGERRSIRHLINDLEAISKQL
jgi:hypothetical protein